MGVDTFGGPVIDPTENVLGALDKESEHRDALRYSDNHYQDAMREAETRRINELAAQKQTFDLELAKVLRANQDAASTLLATQLKEVKNDLSDRTAKLEQFRWETGGKTTGRSDVWGYIVTAATAGAALAGIVAFAVQRSH